LKSELVRLSVRRVVEEALESVTREMLVVDPVLGRLPDRHPGRHPVTKREGVRRSTMLAAVVAAGCGAAPSPTSPVVPIPAVREESLHFVSPGAQPGHSASLCGTLSLPDSPSPVPGVVLIHGSGDHDRDEVLPGVLALERSTDGIDGRLDGTLTFRQPVAVFRDIAHALTRRGYAVLRYDKRTWLASHGSNCGPTPQIDPFTFSIGDLVADSAAAAAVLRARSEVDGARIFIVGHSEGAHIAVAQAGDPDVRGVAMLAGPGRPIDVELLDQFDRARAYLLDLPPGAARDEGLLVAEEQLASATDGFQRLRDGSFEAGETLFGAGRNYWYGWLDLSDRVGDLVATSEIPLLLLGGAQDFNVPPTSFEILRSRARAKDSAVLLPRHTHALTDTSTALLPEQSVSGDVTAALAEWIGRHSN
jgi:dienelactone hydrolase